MRGIGERRRRRARTERGKGEAATLSSSPASDIFHVFSNLNEPKLEG